MAAPRLGFLGVGWIGRDRMRAIAAASAGTVVAVADADAATASAAATEFHAEVVEPDELLATYPLDGIVIATPSALHAGQTITALDRGVAVFCQKPLGRTAAEVRNVAAAALRSGKLLGVDLSYRHLAASQAIHGVVERGEIGDVYATELVFHNAYGPDKPWFLDREQSGGGCVIDLATHLVDLATWMLPKQRLQVASAKLYAKGRAVRTSTSEVEDFASVTLDTSTGGTVALACSWFLHAGCDSVIRATFYGASGSVSLGNVSGSFYDFEADLRRGTQRELLVSPPDAWGGRAAVAWAQRLGRGGSTDERELRDFLVTATLIDEIYSR